MNFGEEYFLFIDDSEYELCEVLIKHEYIDLLRAESRKDIGTNLQVSLL